MVLHNSIIIIDSAKTLTLGNSSLLEYTEETKETTPVRGLVSVHELLTSSNNVISIISTHMDVIVSELVSTEDQTSPTYAMQPTELPKSTSPKNGTTSIPTVVDIVLNKTKANYVTLQ
ncbi:unnamed protein product [Cochlearia groenlandica]